MNEVRQWPERTFDVVWLQNNPDDWMAEVTDRDTGERRWVYSIEEIVSFMHLPESDEIMRVADSKSVRWE